MTRKTRRILFGIAVAAFLVIGSVLLAYARGYRWDFNSNRPLLSGAIYLKTVTPNDAQISINDALSNRTTAALIKNLLPLRRYQTQVAKTGYQTWQKEFEVTPGLVTEAENIILFPEKLALQVLWPDPALSDFDVSPNQKLMAVKTGSAKLTIRDLADLKATATPLAFPDKIKTKDIGFVKNNRGWSNNSKKFIFSRGIGARTIWYVWDSEAKKLTDLTALYERKIVVKQPSASPLPVKFNPSKILWFAGDDNLLILMADKLFRLDIAGEAVTDLNLSDAADFDVYGERIVALKKPDILLAMDSAADNVSVLGQTGFMPQDILISPDGAKIAYADKDTLGVMWLKDTAKQPSRKTGDQELIYQTTGSISEIYWHNHSEHLIFLESQNLKTVELDTRDQVNMASWPNAISALNYLAKDSKLFILEAGAVKYAEGNL